MIEDQGVAMLAAYDVVLSGSHPEYSSDRLLDVYADHQERGGGIMYLGGNGFEKRVAVDPARPWLLELRRGDAAGIWQSEPGESRHQTDGRTGGTWRTLGRPTNVTFGLGYAVIGFGGSASYRIPAGCDLALLPDELREVLAEVGDGRFGTAGLEIDCHDVLLGSSPLAVVFGEADELPGRYVPAKDYLGDVSIDAQAAVTGHVRGHLAWIPRRGGIGSTFAVGSIGWTAGLNTPGDPTRVRAITLAALRALLRLT